MVGTSNLFVLVLLPLGITAVSIVTERESVVRREPESVQLSANGELMQQSVGKAKTVTDAPATDDTVTTEAPGVEQMPTSYCDVDWIAGPDGETNCTDLVQHHLILDEAKCLDAANFTNAYVNGTKGIQLDATNPVGIEDKRPKGCYSQPCDDATGTGESGICFKYNAIGEPNWPTVEVADGTGAPFAPICWRPKNMLGVQDVEGCGAHVDYQIIDDLDTCLGVANCLSKTVGEISTIGTYNASRHLDHPRGCFVANHPDGKVYWNPPNPVGLGTSVKGTPICQVKKTLKYGAGGTIVDTTLPVPEA